MPWSAAEKWWQTASSIAGNATAAVMMSGRSMYGRGEAQPVQCSLPPDRVLGTVATEDPVELALEFVEVAEREPHEREVDADAVCDPGIGLVRPLEGGQHVGHLRQPHGGIETVAAPPDLLAPVGEPAGVPVSGRGQLAGLAEAIEGELANRLQQSIPAVALVELHQALVHEPGEHVEDVDRGNEIAVARNGLGGIEGERPLEHCETAQHRLLGGVEQVDAPRNRRQQRLLTGQRGAGPAREQPEGVVETGGQSLQAERSCPRRRQLKGQRDAVQPGADRSDVRNLVIVHHQVRTGLASTRSRKSTAASKTSSPPSVTGSSRCGAAIDGTRHTISPGSPSGSRLVISTRRSGHPVRQPLGRPRRVVDDMLGVVEHDQHGSRLAQVAHDLREHVSAHAHDGACRPPRCSRGGDLLRAPKRAPPTTFLRCGDPRDRRPCAGRGVSCRSHRNRST